MINVYAIKSIIAIKGIMLYLKKISLFGMLIIIVLEIYG